MQALSVVRVSCGDRISRVVHVGWAIITALVLSACTTSRYHIAQDHLPTESSADRIQTILAAPEPTAVREPLSRRGNAQQYEVWDKTYQVERDIEFYEQEGTASWYGQKFHGYETSNGEIFDVFEFTAAHKSLPLPSYVRVTNLANNESLIVRVNDRGPFHGDRLIDLSYAAAVRLGFAKMGTAKVHVQLIAPPIRDNDYLHIQVAALSQQAGADRLKSKIQEILTAAAEPSVSSLSVYIQPFQNQGQTLHKVRIGPVAPNGIEPVQQLLQSQGLNPGIVMGSDALHAERLAMQVVSEDVVAAPQTNLQRKSTTDSANNL